MTFPTSAKTQPWVKAFLTCSLLFAAQSAMAVGGFADGIKKGAINVQDAIYALAGVGAAIALLITFIWGYFGEKRITDVLRVCMWIVGAGAAIAGAAWLFDIGKNIKF